MPSDISAGSGLSGSEPRDQVAPAMVQAKAAREATATAAQATVSQGAKAPREAAGIAARGAKAPLKVRNVAAARECRRRRRLWQIAAVGTAINALFWVRLIGGDPVGWPQFPTVDPLYLMSGSFFFILILTLLASTMLAGRSPHTTFRPEQIDVRMSDFKGLDPVKEDVRRSLELFLTARTFRHEMGGRARRGLLFEGPPGTGKTYMAKAMAAEAGVPFLFVSATAFQSMYYGASARKIRSFFAALRKAARAEGGAIGFIEEIDAIAMTRSGVASTPTDFGRNGSGGGGVHGWSGGPGGGGVHGWSGGPGGGGVHGWGGAQGGGGGVHGWSGGPGGGGVHGWGGAQSGGGVHGWGGVHSGGGGYGGSGVHSGSTVLGCGGLTGLPGLNAMTFASLQNGADIVQNRSMTSEGTGGVVNELLVQMQSFDTPTGWQRAASWVADKINLLLPPHRQVPRPRIEPVDVLVIAATNRADSLDPALLRPGRFDRRLVFGLPDKVGRRELIDHFLAKKSHEPIMDDDEYREALAGVTQGYSPVQIEHLMDEALINALRRDATGMSWGDLEHARMVTEVGLGQPVGYTDHEERLIATHEAGHAVTAHLLAPQRRLEILTIIKRADSLGLLAHGDRDDVYTRSRKELEALIGIAFGGQVAEELFFGDVSTGPSGDLAYATTVAAQMIGAAGMDGTLISFAAAPAGAFGGGDLVSRVMGDGHGRRMLEALLTRQKADVRSLLAANRHLVEALRDALLDRQELIGREIEQVLRKAEATHRSARGSRP